MKLQRRYYQRKFLNLFENEKLIFGYTENNFDLKEISTFFKGFRLIELIQIHSDIIKFSSKINPRMRGDGIIIDQKSTLCLIKTADCLPLFFWHRSYHYGGIIHVGWRGLLKGIEIRLLELLKKKSLDLNEFNFFLGPAIEKKCYVVGDDVYQKFLDIQNKKIGSFSGYQDKYLLDLKKGILISLMAAGIQKRKVFDSKRCTFCQQPSLPSFRREGKTDNRIFNFLGFK